MWEKVSSEAKSDLCHRILIDILFQFGFAKNYVHS